VFHVIAILSGLCLRPDGEEEDEQISVLPKGHFVRHAKTQRNGSHRIHLLTPFEPGAQAIALQEQEASVQTKASATQATLEQHQVAPAQNQTNQSSVVQESTETDRQFLSATSDGKEDPPPDGKKDAPPDGKEDAPSDAGDVPPEVEDLEKQEDELEQKQEVLQQKLQNAENGGGDDSQDSGDAEADKEDGKEDAKPEAEEAVKEEAEEAVKEETGRRRRRRRKEKGEESAKEKAEDEEEIKLEKQPSNGGKPCFGHGAEESAGWKCEWMLKDDGGDAKDGESCKIVCGDAYNYHPGQEKYMCADGAWDVEPECLQNTQCDNGGAGWQCAGMTEGTKLNEGMVCDIECLEPDFTKLVDKATCKNGSFEPAAGCEPGKHCDSKGGEEDLGWDCQMSAKGEQVPNGEYCEVACQAPMVPQTDKTLCTNGKYEQEPACVPAPPPPPSAGLARCFQKAERGDNRDP
jgi:hypothetical protein